MLNKEKAAEVLKKYNQIHLLDFFDQLKEEEQKNFLNQIENINFELIEKLYNLTKTSIDFRRAKNRTNGIYG